MTAWIQAHLLSVVVPLALTAGLGMLIKKLPDYLAGKAEEALDKLFAKGDAADDELLCGLIKWAEKKYGTNSGAVKAEAVTNKILAMLPPQYAIFATVKVKAKIIEFFQTSFDRLESVALKEAQEHKPV